MVAQPQALAEIQLIVAAAEMAATELTPVATQT
jgi:hypothetical protein